MKKKFNSKSKSGKDAFIYILMMIMFGSSFLYRNKSFDNMNESDIKDYDEDILILNEGKEKISMGTDELEKVIIRVPYIDQSNGYPTGCEVVSATMILQFWGYDISVDSLIDNYLDISLLEEKEGELWGGHPSEFFIGDPRSIYSFGCYANVIVNAINKISYEEIIAKDTTGTSIDELIINYINRGIPVLLWATINLESLQNGTEWRLNKNGEIFTWKEKEHCMVLVGYDDENYYFNDPYENKGIVAYDKNLLNERFVEMGKQSVVITARKHDVSN